jgi:hypothetical protein
MVFTLFLLGTLRLWHASGQMAVERILAKISDLERGAKAEAWKNLEGHRAPLH